MPIPSEDRIRATAQRLGLADEHGNYPRELRNKIAAAVQIADDDQAAAEDPATGVTAELLARFAEDLDAVGIPDEACSALLVEAGRYLLRTAGLHLTPVPGKDTTTP